MSCCRTYPFVHPLRGCGNTRGDAHPYQAPVPVGTWWAGDLRPCRAFAPNGMRDATTNILAHVTFPPHRHDGKTMDTLSLQHRRHDVTALPQFFILHSSFLIGLTPSPQKNATRKPAYPTLAHDITAAT